jgi:acetyltransferase-like isoleucine patch superfamily enzyme
MCCSQEPDCLSIGDNTAIDEMTSIMAHIVRNRCLKFHNVVVGSGVTIGCGSCVLPGCYIGDGASMGDVSLLMKGEAMPPGSVWNGVPAVPCISATGASSRTKA